MPIQLFFFGGGALGEGRCTCMFVSGELMVLNHTSNNFKVPYVPKKITIGLSAWITFKVLSESKYNFR